MKALRLIIHQNSANYKKEETVENKMTYPLPPISTVIGALHEICGYKEYHAMDISIQGKYESMHREPYTDYCFLNSLQDDRGILVKMKNEDLISRAFEKVASAQKSQGNSFRFRTTISVYNERLLEEYQKLKDIGDEIEELRKKRIKPVLDLIKKRKKSLTAKKKQIEENSEEYVKVIERENEIKNAEKVINEYFDRYKFENYTKPISRYRSLTTSLKFYEILDDIKLVLHIRADEAVLNDILENIYDLKCIGRSEDAVSVENVEIVELQEKYDNEILSNYSAYIDYNMIKMDRIYLVNQGEISGTRYYLNKDYVIKDGKRVFNKKKVLYVSNYGADEFGNGLYCDNYGNEKFIVNFL